MKSYNQYCPVAHALDVVGERWSLLIVRELLEHEQLRYSDLHANLVGCGTNILAARLKELERHGVVMRRRLPPPAASTVYELTEYGLELRPVMHMLAHWGARSLGPPTRDEDLEPGWLAGAMQMAFPPHPTAARIEFRVGDEVASFADGEVRDRIGRESGRGRRVRSDGVLPLRRRPRPRRPRRAGRRAGGSSPARGAAVRGRTRQRCLRALRPTDLDRDRPSTRPRPVSP